MQAPTKPPILNILSSCYCSYLASWLEATVVALLGVQKTGVSRLYALIHHLAMSVFQPASQVSKQGKRFQSKGARGCKFSFCKLHKLGLLYERKIDIVLVPYCTLHQATSL